MASNTRDTWGQDDQDTSMASIQEARSHDAYWSEAHARENYFRPGLDYEDYAPAYCVGYVGQLQYRGDFEEAEKSLISNWVRIKGDSRLSLDEAMMAMRAAWDRSAGVVPVAEAAREEEALPLRAYVHGIAVSAGALIDRALRGKPHARPALRRTTSQSRVY